MTIIAAVGLVPISSVKISRKGPSWSWLYGSWNYSYRCNQCLSPLTLGVWIPLKRGLLDTTLCDEVCQWLATGRWFSPGTPVFSTNKTDHHDITEILLKVALNTITLILSLRSPEAYPRLKVSMVSLLYFSELSFPIISHVISEKLLKVTIKDQ